jgi:hypothetical protein
MADSITQSSSKPRVKKDTIGEEAMTGLFKALDTADLEEFKSMCYDIIKSSSASSTTKTKFNDIINQSESKKMLVFTMTNYFLAGEGKGV